MKGIIIILAFIFVVSCASVPIQLSPAPPLGDYEELGESTCRACSFLLLGVIPIGFRTMPKKALQNAVNAKGGDYLINPTIRESWYYAYIATIYCTGVSGTVVKEKR